MGCVQVVFRELLLEAAKLLFYAKIVPFGDGTAVNVEAARN